MILKNGFRIKYSVGEIDSEKAKQSLIDMMSNYKKDIFWEKFQRQIKIEKILKLI